MPSLSSFAWLFTAALLAGCEPIVDTPVVVAEAPAPLPPPAPPRTCDLGQIGACSARCNEGDGASCNNLGASLELGDGVRKDLAGAVGLYDQACTMGAEAGCANAARLRVPPPVPAVEAEMPAPRAPCDGDPHPDDASCAKASSPVAQAPKQSCGSREECKAACTGGDAEACKTLPGIHLQGNVHISGDVKMFGDVYVYGAHAPDSAGP
ncbi:MAG: hypothetical protein U0414_32980 [Polyangiaceae bacterium]